METRGKRTAFEGIDSPRLGTQVPLVHEGKDQAHAAADLLLVQDLADGSARVGHCNAEAGDVDGIVHCSPTCAQRLETNSQGC